MIERIPLLPKWCLTSSNPAFYDTESGSAIEQTAKVYGAMQDLINDYNKFAEDVNSSIENHINNSNADQEEFENHITKIVHDYIIMLDTKLELQDKEIQDSIVYIKENLEQGITDVLNQLIESGEIDEVIVNSFNELGTRVVSLETTSSNMETSISTLETNTSNIDRRVSTLENSKVKLVYNAENESITFENVL